MEIETLPFTLKQVVIDFQDMPELKPVKPMALPHNTTEEERMILSKG